MIPEICRYPWRFAVKPFRIADKLYYVGNSYVSSHLIDTGKGIILIDTTFPQTTYLLLESIWELGFNPHDIKYILHSHAHYDHCGGTKAIDSLTGAKTYLGKDDLPLINERPELSWLQEYGLEYGFMEPFCVDELISDNDVINLGDISIQCVSTSGHTPGAMSYFFDVTDSGKKYKVGMHGGPGLNTLTDEYLLKYNLPKSYRKLYLNAIEVLKSKHVDIFIGIHPGQNNIIEKSKKITDTKNPLINSSIWDKYIKSLEERAKKAWKEIQ